MFSCFLLGQGCALWAVDFPVCPGGSSSFLWSGTQAALASCHSLSVTVSDPFTLPPPAPPLQDVRLCWAVSTRDYSACCSTSA